MTDIDLTTIVVDPSRTYTVREAHELTGIPTPTIHAWIGRGEIREAGRDGRRLYFDASTVSKMIEMRMASGPRSSAGPARKKVIEAPVEAAVVVTSTVAPPAAEIDGGEEGKHLRWNVGSHDGLPDETISYGPIDLAVIRDNTVAGQSMVPESDPHFNFDAGEAVILANALANAEATWIYGPSGSGKTSGIREMCATINWPMYRVNMHADITVDDFVGTTQVVIDEETGNAVTRFENGVLVEAMLNGGCLLIDEVTATPAHILLVLQAVLERPTDPHDCWSKGKTHAKFYNSQTGQTIHAHPRFRIIVTDNTNGQGDITGSFAGTNVMNEAMRSRFTMWLHKEFPSRGNWTKMLRDKCGVTSAVASAIVGVAIDANKGSSQLGAMTVTNSMVINPRDTLAVARLARTFGDVAIAFKVGVINSMNPSDTDRTFLSDLIKTKLTGI